MADMALSDVIEQILTIWNFSISFTFFGQLSGPVTREIGAMCSNKRQYMTSYTSLIVINSVSGLVSQIQAIYHMRHKKVGQ